MATIKTISTRTRVVLAIGMAISLAAAYFPVKWGFANSIALRAEYKEVADLSARLAPDDPQTNFASASLQEQSFETTDFENSLRGYERAAALSPHNYLFWLELGNARARAGESEGAESALRRAIELAPNYSAVQWALGNVILRRGKSTEAFMFFRKAADGNPVYVAAAAATTWQYLDRDVEKTLEALGDDVHLRGALVKVLSVDKRLDESLAVWATLSAADKRNELSETGGSLYGAMIEAKWFRDAIHILAEIEPDSHGGFAAETVTNGGFESPVKMQNAGVFEWRIDNSSAPQIAMTDGRKHSGNLSLLVAFGGGEGKDQFRSISQTVAVEPGKSYTFEAFYRAEIKSESELKWEIVDTKTGRSLADSLLDENITDWKAISADFTVPDDTDGVVVRFARAKCAPPRCAVAGNIWFDDIGIRRR